MANTKEVANAAAKWWTDIISMSKTLDEIQICFFYELLVDRIQNELKESPNLELECDNCPSKVIAEIAEEVGIAESFFPSKVIMVISRNSVKLKDSHDSPWLELYPKNEYM